MLRSPFELLQNRHCEEYEAAIQEAGGIDVQLLGLGRMGHIGFNERGCAQTFTTLLQWFVGHTQGH